MYDDDTETKALQKGIHVELRRTEMKTIEVLEL